MVVEEDKKVERVDCHQGLLVERVGGCHQGLVVVGGRVVGYVGRCEGCHQGLVVGRVVGRAVERVVHQGAVVVVEGGKKGGGVVAGPLGCFPQLAFCGQSQIFFAWFQCSPGAQRASSSTPLLHLRK